MSVTSENTTNPVEWTQTAADPSAAASANLFLLLAKALSLPGNLEAGMADSLEALVSDLAPAIQDSVRSLAANWKNATADSQELALAYSRLFLGPFDIMAPPYASFYLEQDQRVMGRVTTWVAEQYAGAGLEPGSGPREIPDHVALECEYLYYLYFQHITTNEDAWFGEIRRFIDRHMKQWIPPFAAAVRKAGLHPFYSSAVDALETLITVNFELGEPYS